jgi:hypothetical protein
VKIPFLFGFQAISVSAQQYLQFAVDENISMFSLQKQTHLLKRVFRKSAFVDMEARQFRNNNCKMIECRQALRELNNAYIGQPYANGRMKGAIFTFLEPASALNTIHFVRIDFKRINSLKK